MSTPIYCYSNNGFSWRLVDEAHQPQSGEHVFVADHPTADQLAAAFPNHVTNSNNNAIKAQMAALESSVSLRMMREAFLAIPSVISGGPYNGMTAAQAIENVQTQIETLRSHLS